MRIGNLHRKTITSFVTALVFGASSLPCVAATKEQRYKELIDTRRVLDVFDWKKGFAMSDALIKKNPKDFNAYWLRARAYAGFGNNPAALKDLRAAIDLNPTFKQAYALKGDVMLGKKDYRGAIAAYERVFVLDPCDDGIVLQLRPLYEKVGLDSKHYKEALRGNPLKKAVGFEKSGKMQDALKIYDDYIRANPLAQHAIEYRGNLYFYNKDYKKALADYLRAIELFPTSAHNYTSVGRCYDGLNDANNSCKYFQEAVDLSPSLGYLYAYGTVLVKYKRYEKAIELYTGLLKKEPDNSDALRIRGDCHFALKHYKEALSDYTNAIDTSVYASPDTYKQRALVYDALKMADKAKRDREKAKEYSK